LHIGIQNEEEVEEEEEKNSIFSAVQAELILFYFIIFRPLYENARSLYS
jgi:hypothetical protein